MAQTIRVRGSQVAFYVGLLMVVSTLVTLFVPNMPTFFPVFFGSVALIALFLGRMRTIELPDADDLAPSGWADETKVPAHMQRAVILCPVKKRLPPRRTPIVSFEVRLAEEPRDDLTMRAVHQMARQVDGGLSQGRIFESDDERSAFERLLEANARTLARSGRALMSAMTHPDPRRVAVTAAAKLGCPLVDIADSRRRIGGPVALRTPYFERVAAWGRSATPRQPELKGLREEASSDRLCFLLPRATWLGLSMFAFAGIGVLVLRSEEAAPIGIVMVALGTLMGLFLFLGAPGARLEIDRRAIRFQWRLPWCKEKVIPLDGVDTIRVYRDHLAILGDTANAQVSTRAAEWLRARIEAFALEDSKPALPP